MSKIKEYLSDISIEIGKCGVIDNEVLTVAHNRLAAEDKSKAAYARLCDSYGVCLPFDIDVERLVQLGFRDVSVSTHHLPTVGWQCENNKLRVWFGVILDMLDREAVYQVEISDGTHKMRYEFDYFYELLALIETYQQKHGGLDAN